MFREIHRWSDRKKMVELPLFPGYLFIHANMSPQVRQVVSFVRGVAQIVSMGGEPTPIPDDQIENVQRLLVNNVGCVEYPFLKIGQRVRVRGGALDGIQGILIAHNGNRGIIISIDGIERSLAVRIEGYDLEVV
jgi:transcription antitermination factor NusG